MNSVNELNTSKLIVHGYIYAKDTLEVYISLCLMLKEYFQTPSSLTKLNSAIYAHTKKTQNFLYKTTQNRT